MNTIVTAIQSWAIEYVSNFLAILIGPRKFLRELKYNKSEAIADSLIFYTVSAILSKAVLDFSGGFAVFDARRTAAMAMFAVCGLAINVTAQRAAWRLVGGNATWRELFIASTYMTGFLIAGVFFMVAVANGLVLNLPRPLLGTNIHLYANVISVIYHIGASVFALSYPIIAWGALRNLNGVSRGRSIAAYFIYFSFSLILTPLLFALALAVDAPAYWLSIRR